LPSVTGFASIVLHLGKRPAATVDVTTQEVSMGLCVEMRVPRDDEYERHVVLAFVERLIRKGYSERDIATEVERFQAESERPLGRLDRRTARAEAEDQPLQHPASG
jgi:hypothetical protein